MATSKQTGAGKTGPRSRKETECKIDLEALAAVSGRITALEAQQRAKDRRSVYVDGQFVLGLHLETAAILRLKVGLEVDGALLTRAAAMEMEKKAWDTALLFLTATARSRREVERRLARTFPPETVQRVVERLAGGGWLDDLDFARRYVDSHRDHGERRLLQDLLRRGVAREAAQAAVRDALGASDPTGVAMEAAAKRLRSMTGVDRETAQRRLAGFLARRGYGFETISRALDPLLRELPPASRKPFKNSLRRFASEEE